MAAPITLPTPCPICGGPRAIVILADGPICARRCHEIDPAADLRRNVDHAVEAGYMTREQADRGLRRVVERNSPGQRIDITYNGPSGPPAVDVARAFDRAMRRPHGRSLDQALAEFDDAIGYATEEAMAEHAEIHARHEVSAMVIRTTPNMDRLAMDVVGRITQQLTDAAAVAVVDDLPATLARLPEGERVALLRKIGAALREHVPEAADVLEGFGS